MLTSRPGERTTITSSAGASLILVFVGLTAVGLALVSPRAALISILDAASAAVIVIPPMLAGLWLVPLFRLGPLPARWRLLLGASLGLGVTSLLVLLLGMAGVLHRAVWIGILSLFAVVGIIRVRGDLAEAAKEDGSGKSGASREQVHAPWLWLVLVPFLVLALHSASNAPGFIWAEEGYGYDVLEYHLQMPKEYLQTGRISYAPHNVYANFPMNVEMLYLLAMIVHDEVYDLGTTANMIHLMFGALTVFAVWVVGREWSPRAGQLSAIAMGTAGWFGYLSGLAYVEHGVLFLSAIAVAALLRMLKHSGRRMARGWIVLCGVCSGLACGCKYTAIPLTVAPIALAIVLGLGGGLRQRAVSLLLYLVATLLPFSPWLIKNALMTGNPVFPLANNYFRAYPQGWGEEECGGWDRGHAIAETDRGLGARLLALWRHVPMDAKQRFGPAIILLALIGLVGRPVNRADFILLTVLFAQVLAWLFTTHLYARFAVPFLMPLSILAGRAIQGGGIRRRTWLVAGILLPGGAWNLFFNARLYATEAPVGAPASFIYNGELPGLEYFAAINHELPETAKVLMIGDARAFYVKREVDYCVVFNRNPFSEAVERANNTGDILQWLRARGYSQVLVHWNEIARLTRTYGFSPFVTPELFDRLTAAGLKRLHEFRHPDVPGRWVELYEVP